MGPAKKLVLADTSAWICFSARKGFGPLKAAMTSLLEQDRVAITGPIFLELIQGTRNQKEKAQTASRLKALHWLPISDAHWRRAADLAFKLRRKGITVSAVDAVIATLAVANSAMLLHWDSDFNLIAEHTEVHILAASYAQ